MKITEIQLDTLLHVFVERGAAESLIAGVSDYWSARVATSKASATRADNEVSGLSDQASTDGISSEMLQGSPSNVKVIPKCVSRVCC